MNNYSYEEYMNNLLGNYITDRRNTFVNTMKAYEDKNSFITYNNQENNGLEECYPDIYKIIYPMICKRCLYINEEITEELVERITNEIYENVEQDECPEETRSEPVQVKVRYSNIRNNRNMRYMSKINEIDNEPKEKRQRNFLLNDLIKILVLRELLGTGKRFNCLDNKSKEGLGSFDEFFINNKKLL